MAAAFATKAAGGLVEVLSAGSEPAEVVNPRAIQVMAELGIDIADGRPVRLNDRRLQRASIVVTMGCGEACPVVPGNRYLDWPLDDPSQLELDGVRRVRDEIRVLVDALLAGLLAESR